MDQDSFRQLLSSQKAGDSSKGKGSASRGSLLSAAAKPKKVQASEPAFKPRKVKPSEKDGKYRDRASERRHGEAGDFAHVEALLADFEKQAKAEGSIAEVEEKRKYLGGDSEHSVLVKGLDFALLEQNKARAALVNDKFDDESLEQVFQEAASGDNPKKNKKTREELLRELKGKRTSEGNEGGEGEQPLSPEEEPRKLELAKQQGKFKPIGFKPIGQPAAEPKKKKKAKGDGIDGERKKKKRKLDSQQGVEEQQPKAEATVQPAAPPPPAEPEPEPVDEDFDIFAGAGDYEGLELEDDDEEDSAKPERRRATVEDEEEDPSSSTRPKQWISIEEDGAILRSKSPEPPRSASPPPEPSSSKAAFRNPEAEDGEMDEDVPMKLVPLASSALPSVRDFLDMDRAATSSWKNKKRKDKKKSGQDSNPQTANAEAKAERDYKRYFHILVS
ncbi:hypothetical protein EST38_g1969 [Candolleomyces aberdarensis]|uniref:RED-like N-terminal domain-containing protein n=1 Tax=Candolleomyces aberdarensis TaxID=2316362 RepID=A0A4Q2DW47_9AGAR|nr:hypothetical protein EST38_g1969 [Candolleomyces aberdarensis]